MKTYATKTSRRCGCRCAAICLSLAVLSWVSCTNESVAIDPGRDTTEVTVKFLGQKPPGAKPIRFAEGIITNSFFPHSTLMISTKGDRIYWSTFIDTVSSDLALFYSDFDGATLSAAKRETTLADYGVEAFVTSPDMNKIYFGTLRPYEKLGGRPVYAVWTCDRRDNGWTQPDPIVGTVDTNWASLGSVSINVRGDLYFVGRMKNETAKIYCAKQVNGSYQRSEPLPPMINTGISIDPFIDFQDRYLLFAAAEREENIGIIDLYISYKDEEGNWSNPVNLGKEICTPFMDRFPAVTRDEKYLFFVTSNSDHFPSTQTHFYWVSADIIDLLRPNK